MTTPDPLQVSAGVDALMRKGQSTAAGVITDTLKGDAADPNKIGSEFLPEVLTFSSEGFYTAEGPIRLPDFVNALAWLKKDGATLSSAYIRMWEEHDQQGGELIVGSPWRIALIGYGTLQIGPNDPVRAVRKVQLVSGRATGDNVAVNLMPSAAVAFQTRVWDGAATLNNEMIAQCVPLDNSGTNHILRIFDEADVDGQDIKKSGYTQGYGDARGNLIAEIYKDGMWEPGKAPSFTDIQDGASITVECSRFKTYQAAQVTLAGNRTLILSGLIEGMRGRMLVTQDSTGSRTLTPSGGTALDLSTTADVTDLVEWDYDGLFINFVVHKNIQRELAPIDGDLSAFLLAADISNESQITALNNLVNGIKSASLWDKFLALHPFIGGTATAHAQDLKGSYPITWAGTPTHNASGVTGNGTDARGDTGIILSNIAGTLNTVSLYVYSKTETPTDGGYFIGASGNTIVGLLRTGANIGSAGLNYFGIAGAVSSGSDFRKHFIINRSGVTAQQLIANSTLANQTYEATAACDRAITYLARNAASPSLYSNANLAFGAVGFSLTSSEWTTFRALVDSFQSALARANP
jgi:hypothetical protein